MKAEGYSESGKGLLYRLQYGWYKRTRNAALDSRCCVVNVY